MKFVQDNQSMSVKGVLRGLHFQKQYPQGKLVRAIRGGVFDVAVDLRANSKTYGKWFGVELTAENKKMFYIPEGFAHGFVVLTDEAEFAYKCTDFYHPGDEGGVLWSDPEIGIDWPIPEGVEPILSEKDKKFMIVNRLDDFAVDALSTHKEGEVILSGKTSLGFTGFENKQGVSVLSFGFPYREAPKSYIRKLTLAPAVTAYQHLKKGETILLTWQIAEGEAKDYSDFVQHTWEYCYDTYSPKPVDTPYSIEYMKQALSQFFVSSFVDKYPLVYNSGIHLRTDACTSNGQAEVGFIGRVLLNAFNAWEYGWECNREDLKANSTKIFDSYLKNGFTEAGFFKESVNFDKNFEDPVHSIRRQSEGLYAIFHFLAYEKEKGRKHPEWEQRLKKNAGYVLAIAKC